MKKMLLSALVAGSLVVPMSNAQAYHVIAAHKEKIAAEVQAEIEARSKQNGNKVAIQQEPNIHKRVELRNGEAMAEEKANSRRADIKTELKQRDNASKGLSSTATARTDRSLISEEAPASVVKGEGKASEPAALRANVQVYTMRGGDQLQLIVYGHDDLSTKLGTAYTPYVVRPDGYLTLPLIGEVYCTGKTVQDVTKEVTERLAEYIIDPQVTINVTKLGTTRVYVMGQVSRQGTFELDKSHNLIDAVGAAGGFSNKAAKRKVYLVRNGVPDFVTKVNMLDLLKHGDSKSNPELQEGDMIYISSNHKFKYSEVLGVFSAFDNFMEARKYLRDEKK